MKMKYRWCIIKKHVIALSNVDFQSLNYFNYDNKWDWTELNFLASGTGREWVGKRILDVKWATADNPKDPQILSVIRTR